MAERTAPNMLAASMLAGLLGAGFALLLAPRSGRETRELIHKSTDDLKRQATSNLEQAKQSLQTNAVKLKAWKKQMSMDGKHSNLPTGDTTMKTNDMTPDELNNLNRTSLKNWEGEA
ncbi:MAG: hypothetical protein NVS1B7_6270 [Candidatus Saccharimonadales bacterium]